MSVLLPVLLIAFNVTPGPAAHLVIACGQSTLSDRVVVRPDTVVALRISAQDGFANETPLTGLRGGYR